MIASLWFRVLTLLCESRAKPYLTELCDAWPLPAPVKGSILSLRLILLKNPFPVRSAVGYTYCFAHVLMKRLRVGSDRESSVRYLALLLLKALNISDSWQEPRGCSLSSANSTAHKLGIAGNDANFVPLLMAFAALAFNH